MKGIFSLKPTQREYDCVKSVRIERERIARETEGKSPKEITKYFKNRQSKTLIVKNEE